jgi:hypothetical protein
MHSGDEHPPQSGPPAEAQSVCTNVHVANESGPLRMPLRSGSAPPGRGAINSPPKKQNKKITALLQV